MPALTQKPNFLIILADDLGFSDIGCFGGEIPTPNLDALANEGVRLSAFHTASACSPTRSVSFTGYTIGYQRANFSFRGAAEQMLFSGTDNHLAGLGQMAETISRQKVFQGCPGYEGMLNQRVAALSEVMRDAGYDTFMSGKWHLGMTEDSLPHARGFDKVFSLLPGGGNHYGYEPMLEDGSPVVKILPPIYVENGDFIDHRTIPKPFYSTTYFTERMLGYLDERDRTSPSLRTCRTRPRTGRCRRRKRWSPNTGAATTTDLTRSVSVVWAASSEKASSRRTSPRTRSARPVITPRGPRCRRTNARTRLVAWRSTRR